MQLVIKTLTVIAGLP